MTSPQSDELDERKWVNRRTVEADAAGISAGRARQVMLDSLAAGDEKMVRAAAQAYGVLVDKAQMLSPKRQGATAEQVAPGLVEQRVRADISAMISTHPMGEALSETAFTLARALDVGDGEMAPALNKELRATLAELASMAVGDDEDLEAELSTPVRDPEDT